MASLTRLVSGTAARLLFTPATVGSIIEHDQFRTIELVGDRLAAAEFVPGDKLRIHIDGMALRTYTPLTWDRDAGATQVLAYLSGDGPGSDWCAQAQTGDPCLLLGPKRSVRLDRFEAPPIFVGDETSFGLYLAWRELHPGAAPAAAVFEVTNGSSARSALDAHRVESTVLVERMNRDAHLGALEDLVVRAVLAHPDAPVCFTGRAQTIAPLRRRLKIEGLTRRGGAVKAYWDLNRKGLD